MAVGSLGGKGSQVREQAEVNGRKWRAASGALNQKGAI